MRVLNDVKIAGWANRILEITEKPIDDMGFGERRMVIAEIRKEAQKIFNAVCEFCDELGGKG